MIAENMVIVGTMVVEVTMDTVNYGCKYGYSRDHGC